MSEEASAEAAVPAALEAADGSLPSGSAGEVPPAGGSVEASPPPDGGRGLGGRPWQRDGEGSYSFPNGVAASALRAPARFLTAELDGVGTVYTGSFVDGMFHGRGTLTFSNGGKYNATWERGRAVRDEGYVFSDGLHFTEGRHWDYCVGGDRRFYSEIVNGLLPAGADQLAP
ncbi:hypothetical protein EMIHUDRAFT_196327 [Emiliania huxleyi CCMP1516]|uniref:MORN repeat-containing protein 5 n=2 Tax=Emiliania huxleyi TaxID=2903 RepID=A0A0D3J3W5_EMIH1|nr:hypothetical protein EMIHUDRAFT_196327 [Emiliania huxleyi CCMP1516]EOD18200.1 hypothetical protein EMIHUDRAFT_196327 [Emiliania huxleyi CCMP1516]|eukprot:XP_005770629.1 hypothetical protein EMIHUDRAFT_196327 [Emiliania huxleyi CCMP1516]